MADEISDLRLFTRMVAAGSLSETARRTYSSLPAMSRRLAALEARLGVRLIKRGPRRFTLTEEGSLLYDRAVHILSELDEAEAEASAKSKTPRGRLRVGAPLQIGRQLVVLTCSPRPAKGTGQRAAPAFRHGRSAEHQISAPIEPTGHSPHV